LLYFRKAITRSDVSKMMSFYMTCRDQGVPCINLGKIRKINVYYDSYPLKVYERGITYIFEFQDFNHEDLLKHPKHEAPKRPLVI
jgi:hypothetical protein